MNSEQIQEHVELWAIEKRFNAPYGVLKGEGVSMKGKKFRSVTFGRARTLDATVEIYNRNFIVVNTTRTGRQTFKNVPDLMEFLNTL